MRIALAALAVLAGCTGACDGRSPQEGEGEGEGEGEAEGEGEGEAFGGWWREVADGRVLAADRVGDALLIVTTYGGASCTFTNVAFDDGSVSQQAFSAPCVAASVSDAGAFAVVPGPASMVVDGNTIDVGTEATAIAHVGPSGAARVMVLPLGSVTAIGATASGALVISLADGTLLPVTAEGELLDPIAHFSCWFKLGAGADAVPALLTGHGFDCLLELPDDNAVEIDAPVVAVLRPEGAGLESLIPLPGRTTDTATPLSLRGGDLAVCTSDSDDRPAAFVFDVATGALLRQEGTPTWSIACSIGRTGEVWSASADIYRLTPSPWAYAPPFVAFHDGRLVRYLARVGDDLVAVYQAPATADLAVPLPAGRLGGRAGASRVLVVRSPVDQLATGPGAAPEEHLGSAFAGDGRSWVSTEECWLRELAVEPISGDVVDMPIPWAAHPMSVTRWSADGTVRWQAAAEADRWFSGPAVRGDWTFTWQNVSAGGPDSASATYSSLVFAFDSAGQVVSSIEVARDLTSLRAADDGLLGIGLGSVADTAVVHFSADLANVVSTQMSLRTVVSGPDPSLVASLADGDLLLVLPSHVLGVATFDDGTAIERLGATGGGFARADANGVLRWLVTLPNIEFVSDTAHLRGAALSSDQSRVVGCGITAGGPIIDQRSGLVLATVAGGRDGTVCVELDTATGAMLAMRQPAIEGVHATSVTYLRDEAVALLRARSGAGPRLWRLGDDVLSPELCACDNDRVPFDRLAAAGDVLTVSMVVSGHATFPLVPGFEVPGAAGDFSVALLHFDAASVGF